MAQSRYFLIIRYSSKGYPYKSLVWNLYLFIYHQQKTNSGPNVVLIVNKSTLHRNCIYSGLQIKYYTRVLFLNEKKTRLLFAFQSKYSSIWDIENEIGLAYAVKIWMLLLWYEKLFDYINTKNTLWTLVQWFI